MPKGKVNYEEFNDLLNEEGIVEIAGWHFERAEILRRLDPKCYRSEFKLYSKQKDEDMVRQTKGATWII